MYYSTTVDCHLRSSEWWESDRPPWPTKRHLDDAEHAAGAERRLHGAGVEYLDNAPYEVK